MVDVSLFGALGNNLFQYCFGRILAEGLGFRLQCKCHEKFEGTKEFIDGKAFESPVQVLEGHQHNLQKILNDKTNRRIRVNGYFQRYEYYKPYENKIKKWLEITEKPLIEVGKDDIVLTVRRTWNGYPLSECLPFKFYENILKQTKYDKVIICTDTFSDPFFDNFKKYNPINADFTPFEQFNIARTANKLVMSISTFSWWAAFLSNANEIYIPKFGGFDPKIRQDISLLITDNEKYIVVDENGSKL